MSPRNQADVPLCSTDACAWPDTIDQNVTVLSTLLIWSFLITKVCYEREYARLLIKMARAGLLKLGRGRQ